MNFSADRDGYGSGSLAAASFVLGILSIVMITAGLSLFIGALAVILAILSRGSGRMRSGAMTGMITGIVGISLEILIVAGTFLLFSPEQREEYLKYFQELYEEYENPEETPLDSRESEPLLSAAEYTVWTCHFTEQEYFL